MTNPDPLDAAAPDLPPEFAAQCRRRFARFVDAHAHLATPDRPLLVLCHSDADGLAAGAIIGRALSGAAEVIATGKGGNAWAPGMAATLAAKRPAALIVCDLGLRAEPVLDGTPTFFIDHPRPTGRPADEETIVTGYGMDPTPTSGLLARACVGADDVNDWIAAISILSDLGEKAPFPVVARAKKACGAGVLRDATTLLNAPRRSSSGDASAALALLRSVNGPREIVSGPRPEVARLAHDRAEVNAAYHQAKKAAPKFAGEAAMVRIHTPCQVHPLIAQIWRTRLPKFIVFGVNTGFVPGWVHFSGRCGKAHNLLTFLREHRPAGASDLHYGNGHDQAGGGSLPFAVWNGWVRDLGFGPEMLVEQPDGRPLDAEPMLFPG